MAEQPRIQIDIPADLTPEKLVNTIIDGVKNGDPSTLEKIKEAIEDDVTTYTRPAEPENVFTFGEEESLSEAVDREHPLWVGSVPEHEIAEPRTPEASLISAIELVLTPDNPKGERLYFHEDGTPLRDSSAISGRALRAERRKGNDTIRKLKAERAHWKGWADEHFARLKEMRDDAAAREADVTELRQEVAALRERNHWSNKLLGTANRLLKRAEKIIGSPTTRPKLEQGVVFRWAKSLKIHRAQNAKLK